MGSEKTSRAIGSRKIGVRLMSVEAIPRGARSIAASESQTPKMGPAAVPAVVNTEARGSFRYAEWVRWAPPARNAATQIAVAAARSLIRLADWGATPSARP